MRLVSAKKKITMSRLLPAGKETLSHSAVLNDCINSTEDRNEDCWDVCDDETAMTGNWQSHEEAGEH